MHIMSESSACWKAAPCPHRPKFTQVGHALACTAGTSQPSPTTPHLLQG